MSLRQKMLVGGGIALVVFAAGFGTGRRSAPEVTKTVVQHDEVVKVVHDRTEDVHTDAGATTTQEKPKVVIRWRTQTVTAPDGTKTVTREGEREKTADKTTTTARTVTDDHLKDHQAAERVVHDTLIQLVPAPLPRVLIGLQGGVSVPMLLGGAPDRQLVPFLPRVSHGILSVDVRAGTLPLVRWPVYLGAWGSTAGQVGVGVRLALP